MPNSHWRLQLSGLCLSGVIKATGAWLLSRAAHATSGGGGGMNHFEPQHICNCTSPQICCAGTQISHGHGTDWRGNLSNIDAQHWYANAGGRWIDNDACNGFTTTIVLIINRLLNCRMPFWDSNSGRKDRLQWFVFRESRGNMKGHSGQSHIFKNNRDWNQWGKGQNRQYMRQTFHSVHLMGSKRILDQNFGLQIQKLDSTLFLF